MGNATSRQKCPMRPIAQFKTPWLLCDLLFRCGGQFDLGGWVGWACAGMGWDVRRCVALRGAALCCDRLAVSHSLGQPRGRVVVDRSPYFFAPPSTIRLAVVPAACCPPVAQLAIDAGLARLDRTRLRSCEQHTCNAAQTRHPQKLGSGSVVVDWDCFGAPIFWPLFSDRLAACRSERSQCRSGTAGRPQGFRLFNY